MVETAASSATNQRREDILDAALTVFGKEGYRAADVEVIAAGAGVGKGTVYRHFGSKEGLFRAVIRHCLELNRDYVMRAVQGLTDPIEILRRVAVAHAEFFRDRPHAVEIMIQERAELRDAEIPTDLRFRSEHLGEFTGFLAAAIEVGALRDVDPEAIADAYSELLFGALVFGCMGGGREQLVERVTRSVDLLIGGLATGDDDEPIEIERLERDRTTPGASGARESKRGER